MNWLYQWYHGYKKMKAPENMKGRFSDENGAQTRDEYHYQPGHMHWTAKMLHALLGFYMRHWKWLWGISISAASLFNGCWFFQ